MLTVYCWPSQIFIEKLSRNKLPFLFSLDYFKFKQQKKEKIISREENSNLKFLILKFSNSETKAPQNYIYV